VKEDEPLEKEVAIDPELLVRPTRNLMPSARIIMMNLERL